MSEHRILVRTVADCETLDIAEVLEGYQDGRRNEPCGDNRSRAYWHGWRNGMVDGHHADPDAAGMALAHAYTEHWRVQRRPSSPVPERGPRE